MAASLLASERVVTMLGAVSAAAGSERALAVYGNAAAVALQVKTE